MQLNQVTQASPQAAPSNAVRPRVVVAYVVTFLLVAGVVVTIGLVASAAVENNKYNDQLLQTSLKTSQWRTTIESQFKLMKSIAEAAATSIALVAERVPIANGTKEQRMVVLNPKTYNELGDRIFSNYPGLTFLNTFSDMILSNSYPPGTPLQNSIGLDLIDGPTVKYFHDLKADGVTRVKYLPNAADDSGAIMGVTARIMARDKSDPAEPLVFFGVVSAVAHVSFMTRAIFDANLPHKEGYIADVEVFENNVTSILTTSREPNTTKLADDDYADVVQTIDTVSAGEWHIRVRPMDGWKGDIRPEDIGITVSVAVVAGLLAVYILFLYRQWRSRESAKKADAVRAEAHLEFAGYIYHEIRNPTHALLATLEMAPQAIKDLADYRLMRNATTMIHRLLDSALDLLKLESGKTVLEVAPVALIELVEECVSMSQARLPKHHMKMTWSAADNVPHYVKGDPLRLQQVIMNMLSNAAKYCRNTVEVRVELRSDVVQDPDKPALAIYFRDDGLGIDEETRKKLFTRFVQAKTSTAREHGGTGLGLCISKGFVELMGGTIECESIVDSFTMFTVRVALPISEAPAAVEVFTNASSSAGNFLEHVDLHDLRVLFVDDSEINRSLGKRIMEKWTGHACDLAVNGQDAVDQFTRALEEGKPFTVIFMDLTMPVMDGWAATAEIRALEASRGVKSRVYIAALSGSCIHSDIERAHRSGVDEFLPKPCSIHTSRKTLVKAAVNADLQNEPVVNVADSPNASAATNPLIVAPETQFEGVGVVDVSNE